MNEKLIINTNLLRKESEFRTKSCVVEKAIAVSHTEFDDLKRRPLQDNDLIAENTDLMYCDSDDIYHCLLIYDAAEGLLASVILLLAEFGDKNERHIVSVFKLIQDLLAKYQPAPKAKPKMYFSKLMDKLPSEHKAKWMAGAALKKIAIYILGDCLSSARPKKRGKLFVLIGSIAVGFIGLMCLPVAVLSSMGSMEIEQPQIDKSLFNESAIMAGLSSEQQAKIIEIQNSGQEIEDAMTNAGVRSQTIKAQLIYMSYFDEVQNFNTESYANLFAVASDDSDLIAAINSTYGLEIDYDEYMRSYTWVMNSTINEYMFTDSTTKNCSDLAAWTENAYISGWGYMNGFIGERNENDRIRYADNAGLMLGYLNYNSTEKVFSFDHDTLVYTGQGGLDTMPEVAGIGLFDGSQHGIYVGDGEVVYSSEDIGYANSLSSETNISNSYSDRCSIQVKRVRNIMDFF